MLRIGRRARGRYIAYKLQLSDEMAEKLIKREDNARRAYVKQHFHCDIDDPFDYDLVLNTDRLSNDRVAQIIMQALPKLES